MHDSPASPLPNGYPARSDHRRGFLTRGRVAPFVAVAAILLSRTALAVLPDPPSQGTPVVQASAPPVATVPETTFHTASGLRFADEDGCEESLSHVHTLAQVKAVLQQLGAHYGLDFVIEDARPSDVIRLQATWNYLADSDAWKLKRYAILFIDEWSKYPRAWIKATGLRTVAFVTNLAVNGQARFAMPDPFSQSLFLQVPRYETDEDYVREVIHHEFDHCIEFDLFGSFDRDDPSWAKHNAGDFHYGTGGSSAYNGKFDNAPHPRDGFVDAYAMTGIEEDKAEIYAYLFTTAKYGEMKPWLQTDSRLADKVADYKALIKQRVPLMDDAYFADINTPIAAPPR